MKGLPFWISVLLSLVIPPIFLLIAIGACGVGHGDCSALMLIPVLYPFAIFSGLVFGENFVAPTVFLAIVQWPAYVAIVGSAKTRSRFYVLLIATVAIHVLAAVIGAFLLWRRWR